MDWSEVSAGHGRDSQGEYGLKLVRVMIGIVKVSTV